LDDAVTAVHKEYSQRLDELQVQKRPLVEALHHIEALLRLEGHDATPSEYAGGARSSISAAASITDAAVSLLEELQQPLHYKDIAALLRGGNVYIPGRDPAATLLSRMSRDARFERTQRGTYRLSAWPVRGGELITSGLPGSEATPVEQPWHQDARTAWDLLFSARARGQISLFATGICYGAN
jgi:hypothetical protein